MPAPTSSITAQRASGVLKSFKAALPKEVDAELKYTANRIAKRMGKAGKAVRYPFKWASVRQRKAYFASDGFGGGIPFRRRGKYEKSWRIRKATGGYQVYSSYGRARFIAGLANGKGQSIGMKDRWPLFKDAVDIEVKVEMPKRMMRRMKAVGSKHFKKR